MSADNGPGKGWIAWLGILIGPAFFILAAFFYWGPELADLPVFHPTPINPADLSTAPRRIPLEDPPQVVISGFEQTCMSCHSVGSESSVAGIPVRFDEPALLYERLKRYVNFEDIVASALLTKPSGQQHGGDAIVGFDLSELDSADSSDYQVVAQWIAEGALRN